MELYLDSHTLNSFHITSIQYCVVLCIISLYLPRYIWRLPPLPPPPPSLPPAVLFLFNWQQRELVSGLSAKLLRFPELMSPPNLSFRGSTISQILYICETIPLVRARAGAPAHSNVARDTTIDRARGGKEELFSRSGIPLPLPPTPPLL